MKSVTQFGMTLATASLLILAGCGGDGGPSDAPADTTATTSSVAVTTVLTTQ